MSKLKVVTDQTLRIWLNAGAVDRGIGDGLTFVAAAASARAGKASWVLRYRFAGAAKEKVLGRYPDVSLKEARELARQDRAKVQQGTDIAVEKRQAKIMARRKRPCLALRHLWYRRYIIPAYDLPERVESMFIRYVDPIIGHLPIDEVCADHIDDILLRTVKAGAPTVANDLLRYLGRMFDFAIRRNWRQTNPTTGFSLADAGGQESPRRRWLDHKQLVELSSAMRTTPNFGRINELSVWLLLALCVRKMELLSAKKDAFDLQEKVWLLRPDDTKTEAGLAIPLPDQVIAWIEEAMVHSIGSEYLFPARRLVTSRMGKPTQNRFLHVGPDTLNVALKRLKTLKIEHFTVHDMRRTARTHLARMGIDASIAERALNHAIGGVEATYNQWDYFAERREALSHWARFLKSVESGAFGANDHARVESSAPRFHVQPLPHFQLHR